MDFGGRLVEDVSVDAPEPIRLRLLPDNNVPGRERGGARHSGFSSTVTKLIIGGWMVVPLND